jgi:hypothetical protein
MDVNISVDRPADNALTGQWLGAQYRARSTGSLPSGN